MNFIDSLGSWVRNEEGNAVGAVVHADLVEIDQIAHEIGSGGERQELHSRCSTECLAQIFIPISEILFHQMLPMYSTRFCGAVVQFISNCNIAHFEFEFGKERNRKY